MGKNIRSNYFRTCCELVQPLSINYNCARIVLYVFLEPSNMDYQKMIILYARVQGVPTQESQYIVIFETIAFTEKFEGGNLHYPLPPTVFKICSSIF